MPANRKYRTPTSTVVKVLRRRKFSDSREKAASNAGDMPLPCQLGVGNAIRPLR
jgi:hypothetical protein